jgi:tRNA dimethylallyltransferase
LQRLKDLDPEAAEWIHPNNSVRVLRALEIIETTGKSFTKYRIDSANTESISNPIVFALNFKNRETLYDRINKRVDIMLSKGMEQEAREALNNNPSKTALSAIGLKEFADFFNGNKTLEETLEKIKQGSRNYAKRQITWIKRIPSVNWVFYEDFKSKEDLTLHIIEKIKEHLNEKKE